MIGLQKRANAILQGIVQTGRAANAYLFVGPPMSGKTAAAREFFLGLNNLPPETKTVDYYELSAEKDSAGREKASISIEQIRDLQKFVQYGPHEQKYLMVIVQRAEKLSGGQAVAANAFLKLLEEPPPGVIFVLETSNKEAILKTIISRCQTINFDQLPAAAVRSFLADSPDAEEIIALSGGLPHYAQFLKEQLVQFRELVEFIQQIKKKTFLQISQYSEELNKDKEATQNYLALLAQYFRNQGEVDKANLVLKYVKIMPKNINLRLALEVLLLRIRDL